jgi:putative transposase
MGYYVADNMNTESSIKALKMALKQRKNKNLPLIHHSDRGIQYCANEYQKELNKDKVVCNMTQNSDPYENAVAERINGILKQVVKEAVEIYNEFRPHYSNYMLTPNQMHIQSQIKMRTYKTKKQQ